MYKLCVATLHYFDVVVQTTVYERAAAKRKKTQREELCKLKDMQCKRQTHENRAHRDKFTKYIHTIRLCILIYLLVAIAAVVVVVIPKILCILSFCALSLEYNFRYIYLMRIYFLGRSDGNWYLVPSTAARLLDVRVCETPEKCRCGTK